MRFDCHRYTVVCNGQKPAMVYLAGVTLSTLAMAQYSRGFVSSAFPPLLRHAPYADFAVRPVARARNPLIRQRSSPSSDRHYCCRPLRTTTCMSSDSGGAAETGVGERSEVMGSSTALRKLGRGNEVCTDTGLYCTLLYTVLYCTVL